MSDGERPNLEVIEAVPQNTLVAFETPDDGDGHVDHFTVTDDSPEGVGFTVDSMGWTSGVILGRDEVDTLVIALNQWRKDQDAKLIVPEGDL